MKKLSAGLLIAMVVSVPVVLNAATPGIAAARTHPMVTQAHIGSAHLVTPPSALNLPADVRATSHGASGSVWIPGTYPAPANYVQWVSCWSAGNCIGVGSSAFNGNGSPEAVRFTNGVISSITPPPVPANQFGWNVGSLSCPSSTFCALTNGSNSTTSPLFTFDGSSWHAQTSPSLPSGAELTSVSCASSTMCIADGWAYSGVGVAVTPEVESYNGTSWSLVALPSLPPSTVPAVANVVSCASAFCMAGPVAQSSGGNLWMAVLSGGTWSDTEITSITPTGSENYQISSLSCPQAGECVAAVLPPANARAGSVTYSSGTWGPLVPTAIVPSPSEPGTGTTELMPSMSCQSLTDCLATVWYNNYSGLQAFNGTTWSPVNGSLTTAGGGDSEWLASSCPTDSSCLVTSQTGFLYESPPLPTQVSVSASQQGPEDVQATATVSWQSLSPGSPIPSSVTYYVDGQPLDGCTDVPLTASSTSPARVDGCDVFFVGGSAYTFTASVNSDSYYNGSTSSPVTGTVQEGYWEVGADGSVYPFGSALSYGDLSGSALNAPIVGMSVTPDDYGYRLVASDGGIFSFGDAPFFGSTGSIHLNKPIVGMAGTPDGGGYWLVASDGGIFAYGDAPFFGSTGSIHLNKPIVGMAVTSDGGGYWLVASDGGIFAYGDAPFFGSTGSLQLNKPIVGMSATYDQRGYWMVASDGGIFSFGDAPFFGSTGALHLNQPIVAMSSTDDDGGYWMAASDGGIFSFGNAKFLGSEGGNPIPGPVVAIEPT